MIRSLIKKIVPISLLSCYHLSLVFFGAVIFGFPSRRMKIIGTTGTNGKSTVIDLTTRILEEADFKVASISSIRFKIGKKEWQNRLKMTMPGRMSLQRFLFRAKKAGCQYVVLEVTSEGIKQHRHRFIDFNVALITNLRPEHIEAHGSFKRYKEAKSQLFRSLSRKKKTVSIINLDDDSAEYFLQFPAKEKWGYSVEIQNPKPKIQNFIRAIDIKTSINGVSFKVRDIELRLRLLGEFNVYNSLAAICIGLSQGIGLKSIKTSLKKVSGIPGRMEEVMKQPFRVFVDYAHTPDALESVYKTLSSCQLPTTNYKLICVLGSCGGGRDKWKRPLMGKIAFKYCDRIILTNEDPYDEDPLTVLKDIERGILNHKLSTTNYELVLDRREAIRKALGLAKPGDIVIITGKGSEPWMCVAGNKKIAWDDRKIVREEFNNLNK